jgi:hypothetical protein
LGKAYSEPVPIDSQAMEDIHRLVPYIPEEYKNICGIIKYWHDFFCVTSTLVVATEK